MDKKRIFYGLSFVLFVVTLVLWFTVDAIVSKNSANSTITFMSITFGDEVTFLGLLTVGMKFSFLNFLVLPLALAATALAAFKVIQKPKKKKKKAQSSKLAAFGLFILGIAVAVLVLLVRNLAVLTHNGLLDNFKLTTSAIILAILTGVAGLSAVAAEII